MYSQPNQNYMAQQPPTNMQQQHMAAMLFAQ